MASNAIWPSISHTVKRSPIFFCVFHSGVNGSFTKNWFWPVLRFLGILSLQGDKIVRFSDEGAAEITVDSGLIEYRYIIPAQSK